MDLVFLSFHAQRFPFAGFSCFSHSPWWDCRGRALESCCSSGDAPRALCPDGCSRAFARIIPQAQAMAQPQEVPLGVLGPSHGLEVGSVIAAL